MTRVQRRLERVPIDARPLLRLAAVAGRELDLDVLRALDTGETSLERWLDTCSSAAVLDVQEDRWRFAHDKLRENLLANFRAEAGNLRLDSIIMGPQPKAMIDGKLVAEGDVVALFRVLKIEPRRIIVEREGIKLEIQMK